MKSIARIQDENYVARTLHKNLWQWMSFLIGFALLSLTMNLILGYAVIWRFPVKQFLWTSDAQSVCAAIPLTEPNVSQARIKDLAASAAVQINTYDYSNYRQLINAALTQSFTPRARDLYRSALADTGIIEKVPQLLHGRVRRDRRPAEHRPGRPEGGAIFLARRGAVAGLLPHQHRDQGREPHPHHDGDPGRTIPDQPERDRDRRRATRARPSRTRSLHDRLPCGDLAAALPCSRPAPPSPKPLKLARQRRPGHVAAAASFGAGSADPRTGAIRRGFRPARWWSRRARSAGHGDRPARRRGRRKPPPPRELTPAELQQLQREMAARGAATILTPGNIGRNTGPGVGRARGERRIPGYSDQPPPEPRARVVTFAGRNRAASAGAALPRDGRRDADHVPGRAQPALAGRVRCL